MRGALADPNAVRVEAVARPSSADECVVLVRQLGQEGVELCVVWAVDVVRELVKPRESPERRDKISSMRKIGDVVDRRE